MSTFTLHWPLQCISNQRKHSFGVAFGIHHPQCIAPLIVNRLQSGQFWVRSTPSVHNSLYGVEVVSQASKPAFSSGSGFNI